MSWNTPRTWVNAEIVDETEMNSDIRDNLNVLKTSIDDNGDIDAPNPARIGSPSGSITVPTVSNTNILLYDTDPSDFAGIGCDTGGAIYFVTSPLTGPETALYIDANNNFVIPDTSHGHTFLLRPVLKAVDIQAHSSTPSYDANSYDVFAHGPMTSNITSMTVSGWAASGYEQTLTIYLTQDGTGSRTVAFPGGWHWDGGSPASVSAGANTVTIITLRSYDQGVTIYAKAVIIGA